MFLTAVRVYHMETYCIFTAGSWHRLCRPDWCSLIICSIANTIQKYKQPPCHLQKESETKVSILAHIDPILIATWYRSFQYFVLIRPSIVSVLTTLLRLTSPKRSTTSTSIHTEGEPQCWLQLVQHPTLLTMTYYWRDFRTGLYIIWYGTIWYV